MNFVLHLLNILTCFVLFVTIMSLPFKWNTWLQFLSTFCEVLFFSLMTYVVKTFSLYILKNAVIQAPTMYTTYVPLYIYTVHTPIVSELSVLEWNNLRVRISYTYVRSFYKHRMHFIRTCVSTVEWNK